MPTTSRESSKPHLNFSSIAMAQTAPATRPRTMAQNGVSAAQAGVIATSPATAPEAAPTDVGLPSLIFSTTSQESRAAAGAAIVLTNAIAAVLSAASSEPALN